MSYGGKAPRRSEDVRIDPVLHPGWISGAERLPRVGETVFCTEGMAQVVKLLGKTGSGRLLELKVGDGRRVPYFASQANVLVPPDGAEERSPFLNGESDSLIR